jgi:RNA polymerase sigma-70 factor (ECF subfamily)
MDRLHASTTGSEFSPSQSDLRALVSEHAPYLWRALRHLGVRESDVEDACQDVFLVVHRRFADFRGESSVRTWLYGICVRVASEYRRRAHRVYEVPDAEPPTVVHEADAFESVARRESLDLLANILDRLDAEKREVFVLYELEELTMTDVAQAVGCPVQTAYSRLHAARRLVRDAVEQLERGASHAT